MKARGKQPEAVAPQSARLNVRDAQRKVNRLAEMTTALREGTEKHFEATRLTSLKSLCQEREVAMRFGLYLAEHAREQMQDKSPDSSLAAAEWEKYRQLGSSAIAAMRAYLTAPTDANRMALHKHLSQVHAAQNETERPMNKYTVRVIHSTHLLVIEYAIECFLLPDPGRRAYKTARYYAERFDFRHGSGLNPESAPFLQDIVHFWSPDYA